MAKLAVLDIGTNSIHLVLAEVNPDFSYKILDRLKDLTRLGDGVFPSRVLSDSAMSRGCEVIKTFVNLARNKGYGHIEAVATSAVREAKNGGIFIKDVAKHTGLKVRVVTGQEEARLIYLGVRHSMDLPESPTLILDIGGGSVELILTDKKKRVKATSLKLGAIRLKDLYCQTAPPSPSSVRSLQKRIREELLSAFAHMKLEKIEKVIATSGMVVNLAEVIHLRKTGRPLTQPNLLPLSFKDILYSERVLAKTSFSERSDIPGLDPKRVDTLYPASVVLRTLMKLCGIKEVLVSDKAIREGVIYDYIKKNLEGLRAEREIPHVRRRQVISLARRCHYSEVHSHHVANIAGELFDQTKVLHGLGEREREWLEYAAILHDIGYLISAEGHHKHSYYLISHSDLDGFSAEERDMIANIARYHRKSLPKKEKKALNLFSTRGRKTLMMLSAILRIADGLDRSHFGVIQQVKVKMQDSVKILLATTGDPELEIWTAQERKDLFEKVFKKPVVFLVQQEKEVAS